MSPYADYRDAADYIDRTIATVRNHIDADNCWTEWANLFATEIEALRAECAAAEARAEKARRVIEAARPLATWAMRETNYDATRDMTEGWNPMFPDLVEAIAAFDALAAASSPGEEETDG